MILSKIKPLLSDVESQLRSTPHFGVIDNLVNPDSKISRYDYVSNLCNLLYTIKRKVDGIGLGSKNGFGRDVPIGSDYKLLKDWTGLEVCQAWSVLFNAGHLFGTFATERGLIFVLDRDLDDREKFVQGLVGPDSPENIKFRYFVERSLNDAKLHSFHYFLALWRLREGGVSGLESDLKNLARLLIRAYLVPPSSSVQRWKTIFRRARQLAYMQIHSNLPNAKYTVSNANADESNLKYLFPIDVLAETEWIHDTRWRVIQAIDDHDSSHLFGSTEAAAKTLAHVKAFKPWWIRQVESGIGFAEIVDMLFNEPEDWDQGSEVYQSFAKLRVPSRLDWLTETRLWLRDENQSDPWDGSNFLVAPSPRGGNLAIDLYAGELGFSVNSLRHCVIQLSRAFGGMRNDADYHALWKSSARLAVRAFQSCIKSEYSMRLRPAEGKDGHVGFVSISENYEMARGLAKGFLVNCKDQNRENELRQTLAVVDKLGPWRSPAIIFLAKTLVINNENNQEASEIDGLCGIFEGSGLRWVVVECKKKNSGNGERQIRQKLGPCLVESLSTIEKFRHRVFDAWHTTIISPSKL